MAGRHSKYTPERVKKLLEALRNGNTRKAACHYAGIDEATLFRWTVKYANFAQDLIRAEADCEVSIVTSILQAIKDGDTKAGFEWLSRRRPHEWGKVDRVEITLREQAKSIADELGLPVDDVLREAERILNG